MMRPFFAVLGGMGTIATESFIRTVDRLTDAHTDQEFLDYLVFNDAGIPDRTRFILDQGAANPFPPLADDIHKANAIGTSFITMPCNTAHHFYNRLQELSAAPIINMPRETLEWIARRYPRTSHPRIGFMGTMGSISSDIYRIPVEQAGYEFVTPDEPLQREIDALIYLDVKGGRTFDERRYLHPIEALLHNRHCDVVVLGCTELSVLNEAFPHHELPVVDAQEVLAHRTVEMARHLRG